MDQSTNKLDEILTILQEECVEVVQAVCKIQRFGFESCHPSSTQTNREHLAEEIGDLEAMIDLLKLYNVVTDNEIEAAKIQKINKLKKWSNIYVQNN